MITVGSLFSGIGGIDLGLERVGMTVKWQSEIEPYSCRVLKKHWPDIPNLGNIKEVNWEEVERVDVIAGGYPCQPFSLAGQRNGTEDPRHLWPEYLRAISVLRPRVAFLENVRGHYSLGFDSVLGDLADIGYDAEWEIISAQSVGAPHRRERLICLAYPNDSGSGACRSDANQHWEATVAGWNDEPQSELGRFGQSMADTNRKFVGQHWSSYDVGCVNRIWRDNSRRQTTNDIGQWWATEPDVGRVAHGIPARVDRLRGLGNAVVPQVAEVVGRVIMEMLTPL